MPSVAADIYKRIEASLPIALLRARSVTSHRFKPFTDEVGLTQPQWRVLRALAGEAGLDSRTLARRCVLMPPSVSRIVRDLEQRGLVMQAQSRDRRHKPLEITEEGWQLFNAISARAHQVYQQIEAAYGADELRDLVARLNRLIDVCEALPDADEGKGPHEGS